MWSVEWTIACLFVFCRLTIVMSVLRKLQLLIISLWYLQPFRTLSVYKRRMSCFDGQLNQISVNALHTFFLILYSAFLYEIRCSGTSLWELLFTHLAGIVLWQTIRGYYTQVCNVHLFTGIMWVFHFLLIRVVIV